MVIKANFKPHAGPPPYIGRVKRTQTSNLIGNWPMDDGLKIAVAEDYSMAGGKNGTYSNVTLQAARTPFVGKAPLFNGSNSYVSIYSTALNAAFSSNLLTLSAWAKVSEIADWTNTQDAYIFQIGADANNRVGLYKLGSDSKLYAYHIAGGTTTTSTGYTTLTDDWVHVALTVGTVADALKFYVNGTLISSTGSLGTWSGALAADYCRIGCDNGSSAAWRGYLCHPAIWSAVLTAGEIAALAKKQ